MKNKLLIPLAAVLALLTASPARGAELDPSFGREGISAKSLRLSDWRTAPVKVAAARDGSIFVATNHELVRFRADGRLDRSFGLEGVLALEQVEGLYFQIEDVAVDRQGRPVVFGTSEDSLRTFEVPTYWLPTEVHPTWVTVLRFDSRGALDTSFGGDGIVRTDLGAPRLPEAEDRVGPAVTRSLAGAVDSSNRPVLLAAAVEINARESHSHLEWESRFVARLTVAGDLDPGFGAGTGTVTLDSYQNQGISLAGNGSGLIWGDRPATGLNPGGTIATSYRSPGYARDAVIDRSGRILLLGGEEAQPPRVFRLRSNGAFDRSFGRGGRVVLRPPGMRSGVSSLAVDRRGRPVLIGATGPRASRPGSLPAGNALLVGRLAKTGSVDRTFGQGGWLVTDLHGTKVSFPHPEYTLGPGSRSKWATWARLGPQGALDGAGRLVVGAGADYGLGGVLLARYRLGGPER